MSCFVPSPTLPVSLLYPSSFSQFSHLTFILLRHASNSTAASLLKCVHPLSTSLYPSLLLFFMHHLILHSSTHPSFYPILPVHWHLLFHMVLLSFQRETVGSCSPFGNKGDSKSVWARLLHICNRKRHITLRVWTGWSTQVCDGARPDHFYIKGCCAKMMGKTLFFG